jgi:hypothetical protein
MILNEFAEVVKDTVLNEAENDLHLTRDKI